jgi:methylase of polypeptide subunit release factors
MDRADSALVELGRALRETHYRFVAVTPETHARVLAADPRDAKDLRDIFGWSRPFRSELLPKPLLELGRSAGIFELEKDTLRSTVRFSTLDDHLFVHSAYPTVEHHAVFFGPDTYRFCAFVRRSLGRAGRLVDVGTGSGAGGIVAAALAKSVVLSDVNPRALRCARVNAAVAGVAADIVESDLLDGVDGPIDTILANPPYLADGEHRLYRDGGGRFGEAFALRLIREALGRLSPDGRLVVYTGAPILDGRDVLREAVEPLCREAGATFGYEELDPDVFGSELELPAYRGVERIAAVGIVARKAP